MLAKSPDQYTVGDILRCTEGSLDPVDCAGQDPVLCDRSADCVMLPVWKGLSRVINEYGQHHPAGYPGSAAGPLRKRLCDLIPRPCCGIGAPE